jgi:hydroxymethylbilane synthase
MSMRLRLLSRGSDLAVLQARLVAAALTARWPGLEIDTLVRTSAGDRQPDVALTVPSDKGLFTADLSAALAAGEADAVVHSWKDLPVEGRRDTVIAATLERADPRDVLLVRRDVAAARPGAIAVLTSSPRRSAQLEQTLSGLLPWTVDTVVARPVRGNIPTRLRKLLARDGDGLIVAKAALDRLLGDETPAEISHAVRSAIAECRWMVLPLRECPTAPAQGALAVEADAARQDVVGTLAAVNHEATHLAVTLERAILAAQGGGCHEALGATVLLRDYGQIRSIRGRTPDGRWLSEWSLRPTLPRPPRASGSALIWPRADERTDVQRRPLEVTIPTNVQAFWIARAEAAPSSFSPDRSQIVWAAGTRTWQKLADRGIWVHGCADGLGDEEAPSVDRLAGRALSWLRLTHSEAVDSPADTLATYAVARALPADLGSRTHFFWTSGTLFRRALEAHPGLAAAWHASGPGRTARALRDELGPSGRVSIWLEYEQWLQHVTS